MKRHCGSFRSDEQENVKRSVTRENKESSDLNQSEGMPGAVLVVAELQMFL